MNTKFFFLHMTYNGISAMREDYQKLICHKSIGH